jgi:hypothetical protein
MRIIAPFIRGNADHQPDDRGGDCATHGTACHGCLLIAEMSCEMRNLFLDRLAHLPKLATVRSAVRAPLRDKDVGRSYGTWRKDPTRLLQAALRDAEGAEKGRFRRKR